MRAFRRDLKSHFAVEKLEIQPFIFFFFPPPDYRVILIHGKKIYVCVCAFPGPLCIYEVLRDGRIPLARRKARRNCRAEAGCGNIKYTAAFAATLQ